MEEAVKLYLKTGRGDDGLKEVRGTESIFTKPTLLCCSGNGCTHDRPDLANGFSKRAEALLNTLDINYSQKPFQVATVTYDDEIIGAASFYVNEGRENTLFRKFVDTQLVPLLIGIDGKKLPVEQVQANFRNIQILTFSFGSVFVQQVGNVLVDKMQALGYSQPEIDRATSQILVVTAGSVANIGKGKAKFTRINVYHGNDIRPEVSVNTSPARTLRSSLPANDYFARTIRADKESGGFAVDNTSTEALVMSKTIPGLDTYPWRLDDSKDDSRLERISDPDFHGTSSYFNITLDHAGVMLRSAMAIALHNGLENALKNAENPGNFTPLAAPKALLRLPDTGIDRNFVKLARGVGYQERMDSAFGQTNHRSSS